MPDKIRPKILALTMGDPAGIGPEVIIKALSKRDIRKSSRFIIIGNEYILDLTAARLKRRFKYTKVYDIDDFLKGDDDVGVIHCEDKKIKAIELGKVSGIAGRASVEYVEKGIELCMNKKADALVTGPINKESIYAAGYCWAGHTEILASLTQSRDVVMMLVGGKLRVALVTTHLALKDVFKNLKKERIVKTIVITAQTLKKYFGIKNPRIGVSALNPHAGDGGRFGREEIEIIAPAVREAKSLKIKCQGPFPPDSIFVRAICGEFDAVVAMYHDQGLIPLKSHAFGKSVNITLGIPIIRTSVDHGTAFDIVGKGLANPGGMITAIRTALFMCGARK